MASPVDPPTLLLLEDDLVDWLELTAIFDSFGVARIDALLGALHELREHAEADIGEQDRMREQIIERIENEVEVRKSGLGDAYPFELNSHGTQLELRQDWRELRFSFYLVCLVTTHVTGSAILRVPPTNGLLTRLRNDVFQIIATLGLAGLSSGPAFSVGWPRRSGETIVELMTRASAMGGGFDVRTPPGRYVSPQEKDGGIDVMSWTAEAVPPPPVFYFGQTASGKNWPDKPVTEHARVFIDAYAQDFMSGNRTYVTLIPYRVLDIAFWNTQHKYHRAILDRIRLPARAQEGLRLAENGTHNDSFGRVAEVPAWLSEYIEFAQAA